MADEMAFGMDGFDLANTKWYNPQTGVQFTIRENYIEDNDMVIITTTGNRLSLSQLEQYVKWDGQGDPPLPAKPQQTVVPKVNSDLPPEVANILAGSDSPSDTTNNEPAFDPNDPYAGILPEDIEMMGGNINTPAQSPSSQSTPPTQPINTPPATQNSMIIERALSKTEMPDWNLSILWSKFPEKEISMLVDLMDVSVEEIAEYYINKLRNDMQESIMHISGQFEDFFLNKLGKSTKTIETSENPEPPINKSNKKKNGK